MNQFTYKIIEKEITELIKAIFGYLESVSLPEVDALLSEFIEESTSLQEKTKLRIAFIGQYAAGKSTIISALTGNKDIKIGQGITTDRSEEYSWDNVYLVDTPGIYAGRKDHDQISLKNMDSAHLLVYVVTINGFDDIIGPNFRKHAFEEDKINKMMLVMNKRSMENDANEANWIGDAERVIVPSTVSELKLSIIDALDYMEGQEEHNLDDKAELIRISHFDDFISNLNGFIEEKGLLGKLIAPINLIRSFTNKIVDILTADSDEVLKLQELLRQKRFIIIESSKRLKRNINMEVNRLKADILQKGFSFVTMISDSADLDELEIENDKVMLDIEQHCRETNQKIEEIIIDEINVLLEELGGLANSDLMADLSGYRDANLDFSVSIEDKRVSEKMKKFPEVIGNIGKFLSSKAANETVKGASGLKAVTNSDLHKTILKIGDVINHKFKPWGAVKLADKIGKVGKVMGVAQIVLGPAMAIWEDRQEEKFAKQIKEVRIAVRHRFKLYAETIVENYNEIITKIDKDLYGYELEELERENDGLRSNDKKRNETVLNLLTADKKAKLLLGNIESVRSNSTQ